MSHCPITEDSYTESILPSYSIVSLSTRRPTERHKDLGEDRETSIAKRAKDPERIEWSLLKLRGMSCANGICVFVAFCRKNTMLKNEEATLKNILSHEQPGWKSVIIPNENQILKEEIKMGLWYRFTIGVNGTWKFMAKTASNRRRRGRNEGVLCNSVIRSFWACTLDTNYRQEEK